MLGSIVDNRYRILRLIGEGGMSAVYEAQHTGTGRHVALKLLARMPRARNRRALARFQREARAIGAVESQHIVQVLDSGTDPTTDAEYIVMEHLKGEDLQQVLDRIGPLSPLVALRVVAQACVGLQRAHEARIVHRDIKPANLFLSRREDGEVLVKLLDFGIAKIWTEPGQGDRQTAGLTTTGSVIGSPLYMSPEQVEGMSHTDHRTDIWSLGVVLYGALSGRAPNAHIPALARVLFAITTEPPRPVQELAPWVPREIAALVHGALQRDMESRIQSAAAMLDAIRPLLPNGWTLREEMLVAPGEAERAVKAPRWEPSPGLAATEEARPSPHAEVPQPARVEAVQPAPPAPAKSHPSRPSARLKSLSRPRIEAPEDSAAPRDAPSLAAPFLTPPHLTDPGKAIAIWFTRPAGMVIQMRKNEAWTAELTRLVSQDAYARLLRHMALGERAIFAYDLAQLTHYEPEARTRLIEWGIAVRARVLRIVVVAPPPPYNVTKLGIHTVSAALAVAGIRFDIVDELQPILREHNLRPRP